MIKNNETGQDTKILITIENEQVVCKMSGQKTHLVNALSTLMVDESRDRNSFRALMEEAISFVMLDTFSKMKQDQKLREFTPKEESLAN